MKKITRAFQDWYRDEFSPPVVLLTLLMMAGMFWINHEYRIEKRHILPLDPSPVMIPLYMAWFLTPWLLVAVLQETLKGRLQSLRNPQLWIAILAAVFMIGFKNWFGLHRDFATYFWEGRDAYFIQRTGWNLKNTLIWLTGLFILWKVQKPRVESFFGVTARNFDARPYLILLAVVIPVLIVASGATQFLRNYPQLKLSTQVHSFGLPHAVELFLFDLVYATDLAMVEVFFRGFLVIGMARWLGKGAVLPMAAMYMVFHFGKPDGEIISSFFGGFILGVIALETRSVLGGILVHIGIAMTMDWSVFIRKFLL